MADDFVLGVTECIHLIYPSEKGKIKTGRANVEGIDPGPGGPTQFDVACTPGSSLPTHATSATVAVTCPDCKASKIFKEIEASENVGNGSEADKKVLALAAEQKKKRLAEIAAEGGN